MDCKFLHQPFLDVYIFPSRIGHFISSIQFKVEFYGFQTYFYMVLKNQNRNQEVAVKFVLIKPRLQRPFVGSSGSSQVKTLLNPFDRKNPLTKPPRNQRTTKIVKGNQPLNRLKLMRVSFLEIETK